MPGLREHNLVYIWFTQIVLYSHIAAVLHGWSTRMVSEYDLIWSSGSVYQNKSPIWEMSAIQVAPSAVKTKSPLPYDREQFLIWHSSSIEHESPFGRLVFQGSGEGPVRLNLILKFSLASQRNEYGGTFLATETVPAKIAKISLMLIFSTSFLSWYY